MSRHAGDVADREGGMNPIKRIARITGLSRLRKALGDRARRRRVERARRNPVTRAQLTEQLRALGLREGQCVMVHSSLSGLGFVDAPTATCSVTP